MHSPERQLLPFPVSKIWWHSRFQGRLTDLDAPDGNGSVLYWVVTALHRSSLYLRDCT